MLDPFVAPTVFPDEAEGMEESSGPDSIPPTFAGRLDGWIELGVPIGTVGIFRPLTALPLIATPPSVSTPSGEMASGVGDPGRGGGTELYG